MDGAASRDDIVVREIEVIPNGREQDLVFNGRLESQPHTNSTFLPTPLPMPAASSFAFIPARSAS